MSRRRNRRPTPTTDRRPPDVRLEVLVREPNAERGQRMLQRIRQDLDAAPDPEPWLTAARTLNERLIISDDALYYFVELFTECLLYPGANRDPSLVQIHADMVAIERAHGLRENEYWRVDDAPPEWQSLNAAWERRANELVASTLRELGHADIADVAERQPDVFHKRSEKGRIDLWGESEETLDEA
jgi:hypothetical protein